LPPGGHGPFGLLFVAAAVRLPDVEIELIQALLGNEAALADGIVAAGGWAVFIDRAAGDRLDKGAAVLEPGHVHDHHGQTRLVMGFHPGIFGQEVRRLHIETAFQAQDVIGGEDDGGLAAALGEAWYPRVTPELEAALRSQLPGLHHLHVQIYHVQLLRFFLDSWISYQNCS